MVVGYTYFPPQQHVKLQKRIYQKFSSNKRSYKREIVIVLCIIKNILFEHFGKNRYLIIPQS
jgi:hypothetical protein